MLCHDCPQLCTETMQKAYAKIGKEWTPRERCCGEDFHYDVVAEPRITKNDFVEKYTQPVKPIDFRRRDNGHPKRWRPS